MPTYTGNNGNNSINGSNGNDTIYGLGGNDNLFGRGGNDTIYGGTGNDHIEGNDGNDTLYGEDGNDDMSGGNGNDVMSGGAGNDHMSGDANDDTMTGGNGNDDMHGGTGNDNLSGDTGDDTLYGDDGTDTLSGGAGFDHLFGGSGNDNLDGGGDDDELSGGTGNDVLNGGDGNDQLSGDDNDDTLSGGNGNDSLDGGNGNDTLTGGGGLDFIDGGAGTDTAVYSGSIFDYTIYRFGPLASVIHNGPGGPGSGVDGADLLTGVERLQFADVTIDLTGNNAPIAFNDAAALTEDAGTYNSGATSVLTNDFDFDGDTLTATPGVFNGTYGTLTLNANGTYSYVLNANAQTLAQGQIVQDSFTYTVSDGSASDTANLVFSITGLNDAPVANPDAAAAGENQTILINVLANDSDVDNGAVLTVTTASAPAGQGTASVVGNQVQFNPGADFNHLAQGATATVTLNYTIKDQFGATSASTVTVTVTGTNDGPVANPDSATTSENTTILVNVLANDTDPDDGAVLTVTTASAPAGQGTASVVGNQVQFAPGSDFDHLAVGATATVTVSYTIQDQFGATSSSTIGITVTGTNDGPVANPDTAATTENATILVNVLANDADADDGAILTVTTASAPAGQGTAIVVGNQVQFSPGSDFDHLAQGATATVAVSYTIQDQFGATSSSTVNVTVTGTNDSPVANPDTATTSENATILVNVLGNDTDADDGAVLTVTSASAPAGQGTASVVGNQVQFNPGSDFDHLAVGETAVVVVNYSITDEHGATAASTASITVTGTNDAPVIDAGGTDASGAVTELPNGDPGENVVTHQDNGTIAFDDADLSDTHSASFAPQGAGYVGTFTLDPVNQGTDSVGWHFAVDDSAIDFLAQGQTLTQTYTVTVDDGHGGTALQDVTVTITGAADNTPPDAVNDSYTVPGNVTLTADAAHGVLANDSDDGGVGTGPGQASVTAFDAASAHGGTVVVNPDGSFSYEPPVGFSGSDSFTYTLTDADGATDTATVTVAVGAAAVWFIDNAAIGSANLGTQADPYTSIAAFNAAQGSPTGPAAGETVYLRQGTGTYAEADGVNLLNGQTLIGGGQDLVIGAQTIEHGTGRPTIVTLAGTNDGVDLAQNNHVSGLDIGNTTGAGISDGGGSVGSLTISDVGKSGSGQILDVDQGGTLNVTLNNASSTGSSGGAIDLAGVGGSFTVSGATNIVGAHTGGGVDVTGSSLVFALSGGGTISTGTATAVNFVGNSGALALGGGLDIVTTTGAGLNATGGGSVTFAGPGNSVVATSGTAVTISGTAIGAAGVTLDSVSTSGAVSGIVLANTGAGGFSVTGTGVAGSGGAITGSSGAGISLVNTGPVSLTDFAVSGGFDDGIRGVGVHGLDLLRTSIATNGDANGEHGMDLTGLTGAVHITDSTFTGTASDNIHILNTSGTLDFTMSGSTVGNSLGALANDGLIIEANGSSVVRAAIHDSTFINNRGDHFQFVTDNAATGTSHVTFTDNVLTSTLPGVIGGGIAISSGGSADLFYAIENNSIQNARAGAIATSMTASTAAGQQDGTIQGNTIGTPGVANSGSGTGNGITATLNGAGTMTLLIDDNDVFDWSQIGISVLARDGAGRLNATITDNVVQEPGTFGLNSIRVEAGATATDSGQIWLEMHDNVSDTILAQDIRIRVRFDADIHMPGYGGTPSDTAAVDAFLTAKNPLGGDVVVLSASNPGSGYFDTPGSVVVPLPIHPDWPFA